MIVCVCGNMEEINHIITDRVVNSDEYRCSEEKGVVGFLDDCKKSIENVLPGRVNFYSITEKTEDIRPCDEDDYILVLEYPDMPSNQIDKYLPELKNKISKSQRIASSKRFWALWTCIEILFRHRRPDPFVFDGVIIQDGDNYVHLKNKTKSQKGFTIHVNAWSFAKGVTDLLDKILTVKRCKLLEDEITRCAPYCLILFAICAVCFCAMCFA